MKAWLTSLLFLSGIASAAHLEDVKLLKFTPGPEKFELKLQLKDGPKDSYFLVDIVKSDSESFAKLAHVVRKFMEKEKYKLDLNIPSFSPSPSGSHYRSDDITLSSAPAPRK